MSELVTELLLGCRLSRHRHHSRRKGVLTITHGLLSLLSLVNNCEAGFLSPLAVDEAAPEGVLVAVDREGQLLQPGLRVCSR